MRKESHNPENNCLPESVDERNLITAIETSGYPLQGLVADKLKHLGNVTEEWGYIDRDTGVHRSLDIFAYKPLNNHPESAIAPGLTLMAECKRSVHPFIFFKNVTNHAIPGFPKVAGLKSGGVSINDASGSTKYFKGERALGLDKLSFVEDGPPKCSAFSRATLKGKKVELTGTDLFNSIVLPLVNVFENTYSLYNIVSQPTTRLFPRLLISIGVLDAPMVLVETPSSASDPVLTPWVRIIRQESVKEPSRQEYFRHYGIDIVHIDYLDEFISKHLMPFAEEFGRRAQQMAGILLNGGIVRNLDSWSWDTISERK